MADSPQWRFEDIEPIAPGFGVALFEVQDPALAPSLIELFEHDYRERQFGLRAVSQEGLSAAKLVLARRQVDRAHSIGTNIEDYSDDPILAEIGRSSIRIRDKVRELDHAIPPRPKVQTPAEERTPSPSTVRRAHTDRDPDRVMDQSIASAVKRFFNHYPEGHQLYVCVVNHKRFAFDFSDNTFKPASRLSRIQDACAFAEGRREERADHGYSYSVELDLNRFLKGTNPDTIPAEGEVITIHWLQQVSDEPDVKVDKRFSGTCSLKYLGGQFVPATDADERRLDENRAFEERAQSERQYREFVLQETDAIGVRHERLADYVRNGDVGGVLRVLAEDICDWARSIKQHFLHQISYLAKDPFFVRFRMVPNDSAFQVYETWAVRDWIGSFEAFNLLEFHKSTEFARSFSARLNQLHTARAEFSQNVTQYTVQTRGEDVEGVFVLDEARKNLKQLAFGIVGYLDIIATQFDAKTNAKPSSISQSNSESFRDNERNGSSASRQTSTVLLEPFAAALAKYIEMLNQIILEAYHPKIESFEDASNWSTSRQAELAQARERIDRLAGKELVAEVVAPEENNSEQWIVQLLSMVSASYDAIGYVFTSGPPVAASDEPRAKMAANVVSQQLEIVSKLIRELDSRRHFLEAAVRARRMLGVSGTSTLTDSEDCRSCSDDPRADEKYSGQTLVIDESTFSVTWQGKGPIQIGNRREFHLLALLAASTDKYVPNVDLLQGLGSDDQDKIAHTKYRLVKILKENQLDDLAAKIKSQKDHYGLFIS